MRTQTYRNFVISRRRGYVCVIDAGKVVAWTRDFRCAMRYIDRVIRSERRGERR